MYHCWRRIGEFGVLSIGEVPLLVSQECPDPALLHLLEESANMSTSKKQRGGYCILYHDILTSMRFIFRTSSSVSVMLDRNEEDCFHSKSLYFDV